jgi:acyl-CoA thioesterase FadM
MVDLFGPEALDFVLAHVDIDFRNEVTQDDGEVTVLSRVVGYGRSSVRSREIVRKPDGSLAAEGGAVVVPRDTTTGRSRPLTDTEITLIEAELTADQAAGIDF